jgi:hypothetical protein
MKKNALWIAGFSGLVGVLGWASLPLLGSWIGQRCLFVSTALIAIGATMSGRDEVVADPHAPPVLMWTLAVPGAVLLDCAIVMAVRGVDYGVVVNAVACGATLLLLSSPFAAVALYRSLRYEFCGR